MHNGLYVLKLLDNLCHCWLLKPQVHLYKMIFEIKSDVGHNPKVPTRVD